MPREKWRTTRGAVLHELLDSRGRLAWCAFAMVSRGPLEAVMQEVAEFRHYAGVCRKLSLDAADPVAKRQLMEMATVWAMLADEREQEMQKLEKETRP